MSDLRLWMYKPLSAKIRKAVLERDRYTCTNCAKHENLQTHHIVSVRKGGSDELDNLITLCVECHKTIEPGRKMGYPVKVTDSILMRVPNELRELAKEECRTMIGEFRFLLHERATQLGVSIN